ncbi:MAG: dihydrofolate reductase [Flavobacteriales bacterium]|jgi:dihydrofolate reductase|nr:dihydrofolate reductase [Flavobacteriales bacterium]
MIISAIAAVADNGTIGINGDLPWHLPDDLRYFMRTTRGHHVITGRKNYESIPPKYRPLKDRVNLVVTRNPAYEAPGAVVIGSVEEGLRIAAGANEPEVFIIGGGEIFREALANHPVQRLYLTLVHADLAGDTHFPTVDPADWTEVSRMHHPADARHQHSFSIVVLERR